MEPLPEETRRLHRCMRDLAALSALSAAWSRTDIVGVTEALAEALLHTLPVDFLYVRVNGPADEVAFAAARTHQGPVADGRAQEIGEALEPVLKSGGPDPHPTIANPVGEGTVRLAVIPIGYDGNCGVLVAGSQQADFPSQTDRLLLCVGANQAAVVLQHKQTEDALKEADRRKDEFLAVISHELRTPLNVMLTWAHVLGSQQPLDAATLAKASEAIKRGVTAQRQLVEDLLDTARIISGKLRLELEPVDLVPVIEGAIEVVRPAAEAKGIEICTLIQAKTEQITGDPARLQQVVCNLLSNAIKFSPAGGRVEVRLTRTDPSVRITVSDTGKGIAPEFLPYVFDRFRQADSSSTRRHGGLGLGMALVKHLVELHGGEIRVESPGEGLGATFTVDLRRTESAMGLRRRVRIDERQKHESF